MTNRIAAVLATVSGGAIGLFVSLFMIYGQTIYLTLMFIGLALAAYSLANVRNS